VASRVIGDEAEEVDSILHAARRRQFPQGRFERPAPGDLQAHALVRVRE